MNANKQVSKPSETRGPLLKEIAITSSAGYSITEVLEPVHSFHLVKVACTSLTIHVLRYQIVLVCQSYMLDHT